MHIYNYFYRPPPPHREESTDRSPLKPAALYNWKNMPLAESYPQT